MRLAFFDDNRLGVVHSGGVAEIGDDLVPDGPPQQRLVDLISRFEALRPELERLAAEPGLAIDQVRFAAPVPRPTQLLCCIGNYQDPRSKGVIDFFLKSPLVIVGDGARVELPPEPARVFHHEAELAVVIGRAGRDVPVERAMDHVFGYTGFCDVSARDLGGSYYQKKSWATFGPMGPALVTKDAVDDPQALHLSLSVNGETRQDFSTELMEHPVAEVVARASQISGLAPGDVIATGTYHVGMGPIEDGDRVTLELEGVGVISFDVADPLRRTWRAPSA
jgi:2-keto-4-pentenoate hydratase/2-oxohepta-3-ene-1,7-dioic acid hydratase in catechol pathway